MQALSSILYTLQIIIGYTILVYENVLRIGTVKELECRPVGVFEKHQKAISGLVRASYLINNIGIIHFEVVLNEGKLPLPNAESFRGGVSGIKQGLYLQEGTLSGTVVA
ncbi:unknown [Bacteroides sp. CAG:545]|nr:unknown [Bacteroides sp. CAG:545]